MLNSQYNLSGDTLDNNYAMVRLLSKQKPGFQVCHLNAQSLPKKIDEFRHIFENSGINAICVSETWFLPTSSDKLFEYIYIQSNLKSKFLFKSSCDSKIEYVFIEICSNFEKLLIGSVYRANRNVDYVSFLGDLSKLTCEYRNIIIAEDFNCNIFEN